MKWAGFAVFFLAALGAFGMGLQSNTTSPQPESYKLPALPFRALPAGIAVKGEAAKVKAVAEPAKPAVVAVAPTEPPKAVEPEPVPLPEPTKPVAAVPSPPPGGKPVAVAATPIPPPAKAPPVAVPAKPIAAPPPAPEAAAKAPPAARPYPAGESGSGEGSINLKASDTAEVVIDGRKAGPSPRLGVKLKAGKHKVRFDCYDENGNLKPGKVQTVDIVADGEQDIDYECPAGG